MTNLNLYRKPPENIFHSSELNEICLERLKLYELLKEAKLENLEIGTEKWSDFMKLNINKFNLKTYIDLLNPNQFRTYEKSLRDDNIAHWLLGLGYCKSQELQYHYISWELQLFHLIYMNSWIEDRNSFFLDNKLEYEKVKVNEYLTYKEDIVECLGNNFCVNIDPTLYKVKFDEIPEVVSKRRVWINKGIAYFHAEDLVYCVKRIMKKEILDRLVFQKKVLATITDDRYQNFLQNLPIVKPKEHFTTVDGVNLENIDDIAENHYPLCMRHIHDLLRQNHHLKYDCKMQYGIFLYHLGLPYEQALEFWKKEFTKKMSIEQYNAKYEYLFKHQYGKVGRMKEYSPRNCNYIINHPPNFNQHHGCPFIHWSFDNLKPTLEQDGCTSRDILDIEDLVNEGHFQKACTRYFCATKNVDKEEVAVIDYPNKYIIESISKSQDILDQVLKINTLK